MIHAAAVRLRRRSSLLLLLPLLAVGGASAGADWPSLRGRPDGAATLGRPLPERADLAVAWRRPLGSGYSGVVGGDGWLYTAWAEGGKDWLGSFAAATGEPGWRLELGPTYVGHDGSHDGPIATPALAGDRVMMLSAHGRLLAADAASGKLAWEVDLAAEEKVKAPEYGFASSPVIAAGVVVVEVTVEGSHAIAGYDLATGARRWVAGDDVINYQSPLVVTLGGVEQVVAAGQKRLYGLAPADGTSLWSLDYASEEGDGSGIIVPLTLDGDRLLIASRWDGYAAIKVQRAADGTWSATKEWTSKVFGRTYAPPVRRGDTVFGYAGSFLAALDAASGERRWRSRPPGDGFPLVVDDRLLVLTKKGTLHLAATAAGEWQEEAALDLFSGYAWSAPSVVDGRIVARSLGELAAVDVVAAPERVAAASDAAPAGTPAGPSASAASGFLAFLAGLPADAATRAKALDAYFAAQPPGPIVEGNRVHFVYRGAGDDLGILTDLLGDRVQEPMRRIDGTDLFVWSAEVPSDALVSYRFVRDFDEQIADPRNPWKEELPGGRGQSWFAMPGYRQAEFLGEPPADRRGTIETHEVALDGDAKRRIDVWLPPGYAASGEHRYPVTYQHFGTEALEAGKLVPVLDNLAAQGRIVPQLVVFIASDQPTANDEFYGDKRDAYVAQVADRIVPFVDRTYRTQAEPAGRASVGVADSGLGALIVALRRPDVFGVVATQSTFMLTEQETYLAGLIPPRDAHPLRIHLEWSNLDMRAPHEGWNLGEANARLAEALREKGHQPKVSVVNAGHGWESFRTRADWTFGSVFPAAR